MITTIQRGTGCRIKVRSDRPLIVQRNGVMLITKRTVPITNRTALG